MTRSLQAVGATAAFCLALTACTSSEPSTHSTDGRATSPQALACEATTGSVGEVVAMAGDDPNNADLYSLCLDPFESRRLTEGLRVSSVGAGGDVVVVAHARDQVDGIEQFERGATRPFPGLGPVSGFTPDVASNGRLAFVVAAERKQSTSSPQVFKLRVWDPDERRTFTILSSEHDLSSPAWGSGGKIAIVEALAGDSPRVAIVAPNGRRESVIPLDRPAFNLAWAVGAPVAVSQGRDTILFDEEGARAGRIKEWTPLDWSPNGELLLVTRGRQLALFDGNDVAPVGTFTSGRILDAAWPSVSAGEPAS